MAHVSGISQLSYARVNGGTAIPGSPSAMMDDAAGNHVINGTPVRIVVIALAAAAGLTILKLSGFRFNVGVSS